MAVRAFPFAGSEANEADYYQRWYKVVTGVYSGLSLSFTSGLSFSLSTGEMGVGGATLLVEGEAYTGASALNTNASPVRDLLVARRTLVAGGTSTATLAVKRGTPASSPVDPSVTQSATGTWEEPLWSWTVPANSGTTPTNITDRRRIVPDPWAAETTLPKMGAWRGTGSAGDSGFWVVYTVDSLWNEQDTEGVRIGGSKMRLTRTGWWQIGATCLFNNNATGRRGLRLNAINGANLGHGPGLPLILQQLPAVSGGYDTALAGSIQRFFNMGDEIWVETLHSSGTSLDLINMHIWANYLGATL